MGLSMILPQYMVGGVDVVYDLRFIVSSLDDINY